MENNNKQLLIKDEVGRGGNSLKIIALDHEFTSLSIMPNVANSVNIKAINFQNNI